MTSEAAAAPPSTAPRAAHTGRPHVLSGAWLPSWVGSHRAWGGLAPGSRGHPVAWNHFLTMFLILSHREEKGV